MSWRCGMSMLLTDDPQACFDEKKLCQIIVNNCSLCHSLAYYLPQYLEDDITDCDREIERLQGFLRVIDDKEEVIRILRHSTDGYNAVLNKIWVMNVNLEISLYD